MNEIAELLRVTTVQADLIWEDPVANRTKMTGHLKDLKGETDLVILPEMFTTGFSMNASDVAEEMDGESITWMTSLAHHLNAVVTGSLIIKDGDNYYNRLIWMRPDGSYEYYDKRHLFTMAGEHLTYTPGIDRLITTWKGWKICPLICYDLRFPVFARNTEAYDLLIFMANWPDKRRYSWQTLLKARAIENQCYTIGVNRVGTDGEGHNYAGDTLVAGPAYDGLLYHVENQEEVKTHHLLKSRISEIRDQLPFLADRDYFQLL